MKYFAGTGRNRRIFPICRVILYRRDADKTHQKLIVNNFFRRHMFVDIGPICSSSSKTVEKRDGRSGKERNETNWVNAKIAEGRKAWKRQQKVEKGIRETNAGKKINWWGIRVNVTEPRQTSIPSNAEPDAKPVVVVAPRGGEAKKQKWQLGEKQLVEIYWEYFRKMRMKKIC
jgi:hypothetical protein